jgi:hypothetical protein
VALALLAPEVRPRLVEHPQPAERAAVVVVGAMVDRLQPERRQAPVPELSAAMATLVLAMVSRMAVRQQAPVRAAAAVRPRLAARAVQGEMVQPKRPSMCGTRHTAQRVAVAVVGKLPEIMPGKAASVVMPMQPIVTGLVVAARAASEVPAARRLVQVVMASSSSRTRLDLASVRQAVLVRLLALALRLTLPLVRLLAPAQL